MIQFVIILIIWSILCCGMLLTCYTETGAYYKGKLEDHPFRIFSPKWIYKMHKVNKIGAWLIAIIYFLLVPLWPIMLGIIKLCTFGRK